MTDMMEIYTAERERMERELSEAQDIKAASDVLCTALERMRLEYGRKVGQGARRSAADRLFDVAKQSVRCMLSITGAEVKVIQNEEVTSTFVQKIIALLPMAAMAVGAVLTAWMIWEEMTGPALLAMGLTAIAWLETQVVYRRRVGVAARPKINVYELMRMTDRLMESMEDALERSAQEMCVSGQNALPQSMAEGDLLEPMQMLLEAANTQDGAYALKAIPALRSALVMRGIEEVPYSEERRDCFDMYPGTEEGMTIRPALMKDGRVLLRGQATERMD